MNGSDTFNASALAKSLFLYGGAGNNTFIGGSGADIFVGGSGNDTMNARGGRNLQIGGGGVNTLTGSKGADILIAGKTVYDVPTLANQAALQQILAVWQTTKKTPTLPVSSGLVGAAFRRSMPPQSRPTPVMS